jgi:hypothetical protein
MKHPNRDGRRLRLMRVIARVSVGVGLSGLAACAALQPPEPWEKDVLARPEMRMDGSALETRFGRLVYTSKESPSGGGDVGGGGCGCN